MLLATDCLVAAQNTEGGQLRACTAYKTPVSGVDHGVLSVLLARDCLVAAQDTEGGQLRA